MKTKATFLRLLTVVLLVSRCSGKDTITGPQATPTPSAAPTPTPVGAPLQLAGAWSGTLTVHAQKYSGQSPCTGSVSGTLSQSGANVSATLTSECSRSVRFDGVMTGATIAGTFATDTQSRVRFSGQVSQTRIAIQTVPDDDVRAFVSIALSR